MKARVLAGFWALLSCSPSAALAHAQELLRIGSRCADCHPSEVESYRRHGMARALGPLLRGELSGLDPVPSTDGAGSWTLREDEDGPEILWHSNNGDADAVARRDLVFAIGAGWLDRSYVELRRGSNASAPGFLHFAALEVVSQGSEHGPEKRHSALAPWASIGPSSALGPPVTPECLACHTSELPPASYPLNLRPDSKSWQPSGIDCDACHVGASEHADWRRAELSGAARTLSDPLFLHASLTRVARVAACAGCHLQGDARIELSAGSFAAPAPGTDLLERRAIYVAETPTEEIGFVSHVERLVLSRCWTAAQRESELRCETCHDPHHSLSDAVERARARAGCTICHPLGDCEKPVAERSALDCVDCHMRLTPVFDVGGVQIHDHWIRTRPGAPSREAALRTTESTNGRLRRFDWNLDAVAPPPTDPGLDMLAFAQLSNSPEAHDRAARLARLELGSASRELGMAHHVRASLLQQQGKLEEARKAYKRALLLTPGLEESRNNLALLLGGLGRATEGRALLDDLLQRHPFAEGALRNRGLLGTGSSAIADLRAAFELLPRASLAQALAEAAKASGDRPGSAQWEAAATALLTQR
jgi:hypothetical protein